MTNHPKIQLGPDNLYINDKPITDMTIEERIEQAKKVVGHENIGHKKFYIFSESELNALLVQVQDEQNNEFGNIINDLSSIQILIKKGYYEKAMEVANNSQMSILKFIADAPYAYEEEG